MNVKFYACIETKCTVKVKFCYSDPEIFDYTAMLFLPAKTVGMNLDVGRQASRFKQGYKKVLCGIQFNKVVIIFIYNAKSSKNQM